MELKKEKLSNENYLKFRRRSRAQAAAAEENANKNGIVDDRTEWQIILDNKEKDRLALVAAKQEEERVRRQDERGYVCMYI